MRAHAVALAIPQHVVVVLPAVPTELHRCKQSPAFPQHLPFHRELSIRHRLKRCEQRSALTDKLMQLEGKRAPAIIPYQFSPPVQQIPHARFAVLRLQSRTLRQPPRRVRKRPRYTPPQPSARFGLHAELSLSPSRQGVLPQFLHRRR